MNINRKTITACWNTKLILLSHGLRILHDLNKQNYSAIIIILKTVFYFVSRGVCRI